jgi:hypothetical protein
VRRLEPLGHPHIAAGIRMLPFVSVRDAACSNAPA